MSLPPFPTDVPVQNLLVVDYILLKAGDKTQADILWKAATTWGFWYLKNHDSETYIDPMFEMGRQTMSLPFEVKMQYWQGNTGGSVGYRHAGSRYTDIDGSTDVSEFFNISKDDTLAYPNVVHKANPNTVNSRMEDTIQPFIKSCIKSTKLIIGILNEKLGLPPETLSNLHDYKKNTICEARIIKVAPVKKDTKIALGAHTDYGSLSFLSNRLGGLQALTVDKTGAAEWKYIKPIEGYLICNIGDALDILSGGILKSPMHRIVPPPGEQAKFDRWSLVYFARPNNDVVLNTLSDKSSLVAEATKNSKLASDRYASGKTVVQWFVQKQLLNRTDLNKDVDAIVTSGPKIV